MHRWSPAESRISADPWLRIDLTRPTPTTGLYNYIGHADIHEAALYIQDAITWKNWSFNLGIRGDIYRGITSASAAEPRLGAAYNIKRTNTVLRVAYAQTLESPFNENLVLASLGCNDAVINALYVAGTGLSVPDRAAQAQHAQRISCRSCSRLSESIVVIDAEYDLEIHQPRV